MKMNVFLIIFAAFLLSCSAKDCQTGEECGCDACCVSNNQLFGKRDVMSVLRSKRGEMLPMPIDGGICTSLGDKGSGCLVGAGSDPNDKGMLYMCPCKSPLKCVSNDPPTNVGGLGEVGVCIGE